jgi:hypothetical protein
MWVFTSQSDPRRQLILSSTGSYLAISPTGDNINTELYLGKEILKNA